MRLAKLDMTQVAQGETRQLRQETVRRTRCIQTILQDYLASSDAGECLGRIAQLYRTDVGF